MHSNSLLCLCSWALAALLVNAEGSPRSIMLHRRTIDTEEAPTIHQEQHPSPHFSTLSLEELANSQHRSAFFIHIDPLHREAVKDSLRDAHDIHLLDYVSHNSFAVEATHGSVREASRKAGVLWVGNVHLNDKRARDTECPEAEHVNVDTAPAGQQYVLEVTLVSVSPPRSAEVLNEIAKEIEASLVQEHPPVLNAVVDVIHSNRMEVFLASATDLCEAAARIATVARVLFIERHLPLQLSNRWSRGIVNEGTSSGVDFSDHDNLISYKYDLKGQYQTIGVADSGIDMDNCFLRDSSAPDPYVDWSLGTPTSANVPVVDARKVISYVKFLDGVDDEIGHGTHVAGTVAGNPESGLSSLVDFSGGAPEAKIAFFDIGGMDDGQQKLQVPAQTGNWMLHWAYVAGARIHTNSWGDTSNSYTSTSRDIDEYMWNHKDFIVVVAAGNSGGCRRSNTVGAPATAKNVIAVGASLNSADAYAYLDSYPQYYGSNPTRFDEDDIAFFSSIGPTDDNRIKPDVIAPGFAVLSAASGTGNTCNGPQSEILTIKGGTSMSAPALAASLAVIRQYFEEGFFPTGYRRVDDALQPSGSLMKAMSIAGARIQADAHRALISTSSEQCSSSDALYPAFETSNQFHNMDQGWGRAQISSVLEMAQEPGREMLHLHLPGRRDATNDASFNDPILTLSGQSHDYKFCAQAVANSSFSGGLLRIALVWTDAPSSAGAASQLVNDLDLEVTYKSVLYRGNGASSGDRLNPVEVVEFAVDATDSDISVSVSAHAVNIGPQPYSLVVSGPVRFASCSDLKVGEVSDGKDHIPTAEELSRSSPRRNPTTDDEPSVTKEPPSAELLKTFGDWVSEQSITTLLLGGIVLVAFLLTALRLVRSCRRREKMSPIGEHTPSARQYPARSIQNVKRQKDPEFELHFDAEKGRHYFYNKRTKQAFWADEVAASP